MNKEDRSKAKHLLCALERFMQDIQFIQSETPTFYTPEESVTWHENKLQKLSDHAESFRNDLALFAEEVFDFDIFDHAYPKSREIVEQWVTEGEYDKDIPGLGG